MTQGLRSRVWVGYLAAGLLPLASLGVRLATGELLASVPFLTFFPAVLAVSFLGGWAPGLLAALASQALAAYFMIEPLHSFSVDGPFGLVALVSFNVVCGTTVALMQKLNSAMARLSAAGEELRRTNDLLELRVVERTRELADANAAMRAEIGTRQSMQAKLLQTQKLEALGQLTGGIAHDFNNMLQAVRGSLDLMRRRVAQGRPQQVERYIDAATEATGRAALLTQRLLAFARRQALAPTRVHPNRLVESAAGLIQRAIGPGIEVSLNLGHDVCPVLCDPSQLEAGLLNVALNGRDAMPAGGRLTVSTANKRLEGAELAGGVDIPSGDYVEISVSDTGIGMTQDVLAHAFEPFFTTKPLGKGTGLGLSQLYGFVHQSRGEVFLESEPGQGTTLRMFLPCAANTVTADTAEAAGEQDRAQGARPGTVLLIEDEAPVRTMAAEALRELGWRVIEAADGPQAIRLLEAGGVLDMLITDIGLPGGLNGRQVADAVRERHPGLPVLLITGYAGTALEYQLEPGIEVMAKPFSLEALAAAVGRRTNAAAEMPVS